MTPKGWVGHSYEASSTEEAENLAERDGYDVVDVVDAQDGMILVVLDEEEQEIT